MAKIFIVEDDESLRELYIKILDIKGFKVLDYAMDGDEAVNKFKNFLIKPDIILMDHRMPNKNGLDAATEILNIDKNVRIIFASADHGIRLKVKELGINHFLEKPFTLSKLIEEIEYCLNLK
ncbi:MAG: response regulator [Promethearchaeota archaeon]